MRLPVYPQRFLFAVLFSLLLPAGEVAAASCPPPQTDLERAYCEIVAKGGRGLPSFDDFRRNTPQVQALLLKRPAASLGIELPSATPAESAVQATQETMPADQPDEPEAVSDDTPTTVAPGLSECSLQAELIRCPHRQYRLATNQPNRALAEDALADSNTLGLHPYQGDPANEAELRQYLADAYDQYILKMLEIGLGGATMSFTEFYHNYQRHEASGVDYAQRMEDTFQLLKQDKRTKTVPSRLTDKLPEGLEFCSGIGERVVVCDDVGTNWVFVGEGR